MKEEMDMNAAEENWKPKFLVVGVVLGAAVGLGAAYLLVQRAEREGGEVQIGAGEAVKLGVLILGLLRSVSQLGGGD